MKNLTILLVEDDEVDIEAIKRELSLAKIMNKLIVAKDGNLALAILKENKIKSPYLILLDLNLPKMNGIELLEEIRNDDRLKQSVIFVLTTSDDPEKKKWAYNYNIAGYIHKKRINHDFSQVVLMCERYYRAIEFPV